MKGNDLMSFGYSNRVFKHWKENEFMGIGFFYKSFYWKLRVFSPVTLNFAEIIINIFSSYPFIYALFHSSQQNPSH